MLDDLIFALRNFRRNKIRSFLSLLGIIIGVASVIVITSLSQSATKTVEASFSSAGLDLVEISAGFMQRRRNATITFNETFRENLFDAVANIKSIHYTNSLSMTLSRGETTVTTGATAIEPGYLEINGLDLDLGSDFSISDNVTGQQRIIIGAEIAQGLFPDENPIGQIVTVVAGNATFSFRVAGVLSGSNAMNPTDSIVLIPRGFYAKKIMPAAQASTIIVQCTHQDRAPTVAEHIKEYITFVSGSEHAASVTSMQALLEEYQELSGSISLILSGIAAISLLVGGIGIMNIMIVTVTERRREIGIRKALGASPNVIRLQFLVESALITVVGGLIGIAVGIGISAVAAKVMGNRLAVQWGACALAFVFSAAIGIFFGLSPASRAARLDPVAALAGD
ncbi:MAG: ABC transporter permease [Spirochaetaceae bacterium]|nr:ABC transporter permease [Spirochaetaceae bacterium]